MSKALVEKRNDLKNEMDTMLEGAKGEVRALNETEIARFDEIKKEIGNIDATLKLEEESRGFEQMTVVKNEEVRSAEEIRAEEIQKEEQRFLQFVKGDTRALDIAQNGAVIPNTIANRIIDKVRELSPIYAKATIYNVGGDLSFPVVDSRTITTAFVDDLAEVVESSTSFATIKLTNFIAGALVKVSKSLMNRTEFDVLGFIVNKVAQSVAEFLEKQLINGTATKNDGILSSTNLVSTATTAVITDADLIDLQMTVPEIYQADACFVMHKDFVKVLRKLKGTDGHFLLNPDLRQGFGWTLLGKPVHFTSSMPNATTTGSKLIAYGDLKGLYVKLAQNVEMQILNEKFATQHAIGVLAHVEFDSKIVETEAIAILKSK